MKKVELTGKYGSAIGNFALVDDEDFEFISQFRWNAYKNCKTGGLYATTTKNKDGSDRKSIMSMQHFIVDCPKGMVIDHKNRKGLDNRKENLRLCTHAQNHWNQGVPKNNTTGYKGVSNKGKNYVMNISAGPNKISLSGFDTAEEAARTYDYWARKLHGEFAYQNFGDDKAENEQNKNDREEAMMLYYAIKYEKESGKGIDLILEKKREWQQKTTYTPS